MVGVIVVVPDCMVERLSVPDHVACTVLIVGDTETDTVPEVDPDC